MSSFSRAALSSSASMWSAVSSSTSRGEESPLSLLAASLEEPAGATRFFREIAGLSEPADARSGLNSSSDMTFEQPLRSQAGFFDQLIENKKTTPPTPNN